MRVLYEQAVAESIKKAECSASFQEEILSINSTAIYGISKVSIVKCQLRNLLNSGHSSALHENYE